MTNINWKIVLLTIAILPFAIAAGIAIMIFSYLMWPLFFVGLIGTGIYMVLKAYKADAAS